MTSKRDASRITSTSNAEPKMQRVVQVTLFTGVTLSCLLLLVGAVLYFHSPDTLPKHVPNLLAMLRRTAHWDGAHIIFLGLVMLMITPVARMVVLVVGFLMEKNWRFTLVSLVVLVGLLISGIYSIK